MELEFRTATRSDAGAVSRLVQATFLDFVAHEWEPSAVEKFLGDSSPHELAEFIAQADYAAVACADGETVGFILLAPANQLKALFVHRSWHRRGIARKLWSLASGHLRVMKPAVETVELNASSFAVESYKSLGFHAVSEPVRYQGCLVTRMACRLPGCTA
jgi:GNAT superfamily N-acetyltransferase